MPSSSTLPTRPMPYGMKEEDFPGCFKTITWDIMDKARMVEPCHGSPILPENLPDEIHPLYRFTTNRWRMQNARRFHDGWRLGLRLASYLLDSDWVLAFFAKAAYGQLGKMKYKEGDVKSYIGDLPDDLPRDAAIAKTRELLRELLPPYLCFKFTSDADDVTSAYAETFSETRLKVQSSDDEPEFLVGRDSRAMSIGFHPNWEPYAVRRQVQYGYKNPEWHDGCDPGSQALDFRAQLFFALTLLHETVHVVEIGRFSRPLYNVAGKIARFDVPEAYLNLDMERDEWGFELEFFLTGMILKTSASNGEPRPTQKQFCPIPKYGIMGVTEEHFSYGRERGCIEFELLTMEWVAFWFRTENLQLLTTQGISALPKLTNFAMARSLDENGRWWKLELRDRDAMDAE